MQSKRASLIESLTNVIVGIGIAWLLTFYVLPVFGYRPSVMDATWITMIFTVTSIIRSYLVRRLFNNWNEVWWSLTHKSPRKSVGYQVTVTSRLSTTVRVYRSAIAWITRKLREFSDNWLG